MAILPTIRNHWKKLTFATAAVSYGLHALKNNYDISRHMQALCEEVTPYGQRSDRQTKNVLVIMNPVANKKKAEQSFKKYCEPLLHLAGYSVEVVKTNYVGHAKTYIENLPTLPDAIVVAGGDGTSSEVVTGLLRRHESPCPIVLLPLGRTSKSAFKYSHMLPKNKVEYVKALANSTMSLIQEKVHNENVIKFDVIDDKTEDKKPKPIYGLSTFSWGLLRDLDTIKDKYWYFGALRHHAAALFNSFSKDLVWNFHTKYEYTPPCPGCRNCFVERDGTIPKSYFRKLFAPAPAEGTAAKSSLENKNCETHIQGSIDTNQLNISCDRNTDAFYELNTNFIGSLTPGLDFIKKIQSITEDAIEPSLTLKSRTIELIPDTIEENKSFYSIDGEEYDVRPIKISLIPNAIKVCF